MDTKFILNFLKELSCNNTVDWMHANKARCDSARKEFASGVQELINRISLIDPSINGLTPKDCMYRQARDTRFSNDKSPYKTHFGAYIAPGGRKSIKAGYYFHLQPDGESLVGGGLYCLPPDALKALRSEIQAEGKKFTSIIEAREFKQSFKIECERLKTMPRDFTAGSEYDEYIKIKNFMVCHYYTDKEVLSYDSLSTDAIEKFKLMLPLNQFFNDALYEY